MAQLVLRAGQHQEVARFVDPQNAAFREQGLQDFGHFAGRDVFKRHHLHVVTRLQVAYLRRGAATQRAVERGNFVDAVFMHHGGAVHAQHGFKNGGHIGFADGLAGMDGDGAVDARVNGVVFAQHVAHGHAHYFAQVGAFKIKKNVLGAAIGRADDGRLDKDAGTGDDFHPFVRINRLGFGCEVFGIDHGLGQRLGHVTGGAACQHHGQANKHGLDQLRVRMCLHRRNSLTWQPQPATLNYFGNAAAAAGGTGAGALGLVP